MRETRDAKGWWHSFALPDGTQIDGVHPVSVLKQRIAQFPIPEDLHGRRVLDIGTWDGWFSFEMERRGAEVVAIDNWDNPRFHEIHQMLDSRVEYRQMDMYELTPERIGRFDLVLFMGVLYHLKHPLLALERVCALTTGMAAVESFVLRESHCPNENVEGRCLIEFYETDEFGGQTDNWVAPTLPCLLAMCRTAGFARVELGRATEFGAAVTCYRNWGPPASNNSSAPKLLRVEHNTKAGTRFDSRFDEYVSVWFASGEEDLGLDNVRPEVGGFGVRPIYVGRVKNGSWQTNFKLPPGLKDGSHEVTVRLDDGQASNAKRIAVNAPADEAEPLSGDGAARDIDSASVGPIYLQPEFAKPIDVHKVVSEIHARVRQEADSQHRSRPDVPRRVEGSSALSQDSYELTSLRAAYQRLYQNRNAVGKMPPSPNTLRARIGAIFVRGVQRCLFWYTPQIQQFQNDTVNALNSVCNLIGSQSERIASQGRQAQKLRREMLDSVTDQMRRQSERTVSLEEEVDRLRRAVDGGQFERTAALEQEIQRLRRDISHLSMDVPIPGSGNIDTTPLDAGLPNSFQFALQDRFRGPEADTTRKLQVYIDNLKPLLPTLPGSQWLDLGCGRGEWLELASPLGCKLLGLDSNPASVLHCREKQLNVEQGDALTYLRSRGDASVGVITAFHVVEHWPMHYVLALVAEVARVLDSGGLLIVETPNPENLLMGSANFWNDPTHRHPIPLKLLEFIYEHFGLTVIERLELNPLPREQRFAFEEISVVRRLNDYFYGPQDYGLIGRR